MLPISRLAEQEGKSRYEYTGRGCGMDMARHGPRRRLKAHMDGYDNSEESGARSCGTRMNDIASVDFERLVIEEYPELVLQLH